MRAEVQAFANKVPSGKIFIFSLQMSINIVSLFKHFGRQCFKTALGKAPKRYAAAYRHNINKQPDQILMANRWGIPRDVEEIVKQRDLSCIYCGISFINSVYTRKTRPTWEHIINDIKINGPDNIALCCGSCNASKGPKILSHWLTSKYCLTKSITSDNVATVAKKHLGGQ